jgi:hypothetical protein
MTKQTKQRTTGYKSPFSRGRIGEVIRERLGGKSATKYVTGVLTFSPSKTCGSHSGGYFGQVCQTKLLGQILFGWKKASQQSSTV